MNRGLTEFQLNLTYRRHSFGFCSFLRTLAIVSSWLMVSQEVNINKNITNTTKIAVNFVDF